MTPLRSDFRRARAAVDAVLRSRLVSALAAPHDVDDYLGLFDATWSVRQVRARVTALRREHGGISVWLQPNRNWAGFRAGQHVLLGIERAGVRHTRCFSLSAAPDDPGPLRLSIHGLPGGKVSGWALEAARVGDVVLLSQAAGDFVLPERVPAKLLFVSAGSGVTPVLSMIRQLGHTLHGSAVTWLHYGRSETMLEEEVVELAAQHPSWLKLVFTRTDGPDAAPAALRHLSAEALAAHAPDWQEREAFACGPASMLAAAGELWKAHGLEPKLRIESFGAAWPAAPVDHTQLRSRLVFARSKREIRGVAGVSLLEQAEGAGLHPKHGCRMGICHSCKCTKLSGAVRNVRTGVISEQPNEEIQLCISTPRSDVVLDL